MKLINQLSKETGIPIPTIRFYEKSGLFTGKKKEDVKSNNYTYYDEEVIKKLSLIRDAKSAGFTLSEIKEIIDAWYGKQISKPEKLEILSRKLVQIETKIKELKEVKIQIAFLKNEVEKCN
ncbi:MerR family transcriptional regulator [Flavobacterium circumlabens]|uniref:MerR family Zn(II)-responsive transcriptional regulator of zntA n=1 Tax=Flavobacterium circumlabens TaxID=2133765 RepID=A0A4Y7UFZ8_9FLAO|nr:MerR family transcriptional regulator [Flavobacterium circumlabens]TCN59536.1 MerR family Zn(II)-responsive transcriptional regulator of zntA [Flavobacterium circumlabens]TEB44828.1 MerR family transcriptional regulator [Flavobacterium circumlabens]